MRLANGKRWWALTSQKLAVGSHCRHGFSPATQKCHEIGADCVISPIWHSTKGCISAGSRIGKPASEYAVGVPVGWQHFLGTRSSKRPIRTKHSFCSRIHLQISYESLKHPWAECGLCCCLLHGSSLAHFSIWMQSYNASAYESHPLVQHRDLAFETRSTFLLSQVQLVKRLLI